MTFAVIIPAAGRSSRFDGAGKKVFLPLSGKPVWEHSAEKFAARDDVTQILVVVSAEDRDWFCEEFRAAIAKLGVEVVSGGENRADSVQNALAQVRADVEFVAVHDAARPLVSAEEIDRVFLAARDHTAAILATPITSTVKRADGETIAETVPRDNLYVAQTPQVFAKNLLRRAYAARGDFQPTDEAQLVERLGIPVHLVPGSPKNIKITTTDDMDFISGMLSSS